MTKISEKERNEFFDRAKDMATEYLAEQASKHASDKFASQAELSERAARQARDLYSKYSGLAEEFSTGNSAWKPIADSFSYKASLYDSMSASEYMKSFAYEAGGVFSKFGGLTADAVESGAVFESAFDGNWNDVGERSSELLFGTLGAAFGGLLGSFVGPGGTAAGAVLGGAIGSHLGEVWWNHFFGDNYLPPPPPPLGDEDPIPASPLVLDLNGDGVATTALGEDTHFDLDANGFAELTGWVAPSDGLLALDANTNGTIEDGTELFGNWTRLASGERAQNGFEALAQYDANADGAISAADSVFAKLRVWQDRDQDGVSDAGELSTLGEAGVSSLSLGYQNSDVVDEAGNEHRQIGTFETSAGEQRALVDVWFQRDLKRTVGEKLDVPADIALLPDAVGYGNVHSLHQAMIRDDSGRLQALVEKFVAESDASTRNSLVTEILFEWTGQTDADKNRYAGYEGIVDGRKIGVLEAFWGKPIAGAPRGIQYAEHFHGRYSQWEDAIFYQLMAQSHLHEAFARIGFTFDEGTEVWIGDYDAAAQYLMAQVAEDPIGNTMLLADFSRAVRGINPYDKTNGDLARAELHEAGVEVKGVLTTYWAPLLESGQETGLRKFSRFLLQSEVFSSLSGWTWGRDALVGLVKNPRTRGYIADILAESEVVAEAVAGNVSLYGSADADMMVGHDEGRHYLRAKDGDDVLIAGKGDRLYGEAGGDLLVGAEGAYLYAGAGTDVLVSAAGARLNGGSGNDTYRFEKGTGLATVSHNDAQGRDVIEFGKGIMISDLALYREGYDLHLMIGGEGLRVQNWFNLSSCQTEAFRFADGTEVSTEALLAEKSVLSEASGNGGFLYGYAGSDVMVGHDEDRHYLYARGGDDLLTAGKGDRLYGEEGSDVLVGAEGSYLYAGSGNDRLVSAMGVTMQGDSGDDTYRFDKGAGLVTVYQSDSQGWDVIEFGEGIAASDVVLHRRGADLHLTMGQEGLRMLNWFNHRNNRTAALRFADGTAMSTQEFMDGKAVFSVAAGGGGTLYGYDGSDVMVGDDEGRHYLYARGGDDVLTAGIGDYLYGHAGDDTLIGADGVKLYGGSGDDVLISATGAWLWGSAGNDVYRFDIGAGLATVNQYDAEYRDVIEFGEGIAAADVALRKDGDDLLVLVDEEGFRMKSWFDSWRYQASAFRFADGGEIITEEYLANKPVVVEASVSGERLHGHGGKDVMIACEGVYLYGKEGDDALIAAENAHLHGGAGADEYIFQDRFHGATVYADSATDGPADIARFEDVSAESLWFRRSGDNLLVDSLEDGQRVTFANWFDGARYRPGEIHAGNEVAMAEQVNRLVTAMAEFAPPSMGAGGAMPEDVRTALAPDLAASWSVAA